MRDIKEIEKRYRQREEKKGKINIILKKRYLLILIFVIAFLTNPSKDKHRQTVTNEIYKALGMQPQENMYTGSVDNSLVETLLDSYIGYTNYFLFSTTNLTLEGKTSVIGVGAFGKVYIPDISEKILSNRNLNN